MYKNTVNKIIISIIVPLYHGRKYLKKLHEMIRLAAEKASEVAHIEWVISNDDPNEKIDGLTDEVVDIIVINTDSNRGIQGARVTGLKKSRGDYIVFFDQDDIMTEDYFISQLENIGDADAVVCDALNYGCPMYPSGKRTTLEECITREFNLYVDSGFIPGQVMIKRDSIPDTWINNWLKYNCCDDYYLWLCMYAENKVFIANPNVLYEHSFSGNNQGFDNLVWYQSTREMLDVIHQQGLFCCEEEKALEDTAQKALETVLFNKNVVGKKCEIYRQLLCLHERELRFENYFIERGYYEIAIYGAVIGKHVYELLRRSKNIHINCIIDKDSDYIVCDIPVVTRDNIIPSTDCIINTLIKDAEETEKYIKEYYSNIKMINIKDFLDDISLMYIER